MVTLPVDRAGQTQQDRAGPDGDRVPRRTAGATGQPRQQIHDPRPIPVHRQEVRHPVESRHPVVPPLLGNRGLGCIERLGDIFTRWGLRREREGQRDRGNGRGEQVHGLAPRGAW
ncbi:MAG: hypothetical protein JNL08_02765 [Planctomycetes bacterium]|nr:hypothetical protein [Planctomycetota bacterium]